MIRLAPMDTRLWSFALEWNASLRVIGFFGDLVAAQKHVNSLPDLDWKWIDMNRRYRQEIPIDSETDVLFVADEELTPSDREMSAAFFLPMHADMTRRHK